MSEYGPHDEVYGPIKTEPLARELRPGITVLLPRCPDCGSVWIPTGPCVKNPNAFHKKGP